MQQDLGMSKIKKSSKVVAHGTPNATDDEFIWEDVCLGNLDLAYRAAFTDWSLLLAGEQSRAERLRSPLARQRLSARCAFARQVLRQIVSVAPAVPDFCEGAHCDPQLADWIA
ncbi:MAG TPA: hypothetical protein VFA77_05385 [Candidatus Eisenbacteria bacterium]|nr:hypothetical protein [Candidatus Eisenbacteria bacterium]